MYVGPLAHIQFSVVGSNYLKEQIILTVKISKMSWRMQDPGGKTIQGKGNYFSQVQCVTVGM